MASFYGTLGIAVFIGFLAGLGLVGLVGLIKDYFLTHNLNRNHSGEKREYNGNKNGKSGTVGKSRAERHGRG